MPTESHEDFSQVSGNKLVMLRDNLQSSISKREKTIESMQERVKSSPEDRTILNLLNRKLEQLEQKKIDLETIRKIETIKKSANPAGFAVKIN
jgi:regulator of replication initiation timing